MKKLLFQLITLVALAGFTSVLRAGEVHATGTFEGRTDHVTKGTATIEKQDGNWVVVLGKDFSLDGAPDPKVGLGKDGYQKSAKLGHLSSKTGQQTYSIKAGLDPADFNEVWIWCEKFNVPLGVAKLKTAG